MNKNIKYSQNFLTSEKVLNQIIKQLNLKETDTVYEIGTGKGHLTTKLAKISKQVTSIELDSHLFNLSSEKLKLNTRVTLIHQDILQFQFPNKQKRLCFRLWNAPGMRTPTRTQSAKGLERPPPAPLSLKS